MNVALFVPCYVDQFYPQVGIATMELLKKQGCTVHYPLNQTCCGQPMANAGFAAMSVECDRNFIENFKAFDYIVAPSGSCVLHIKEHLHSISHEMAAAQIRNRVYELTEFMTDVLKTEKLLAYFPHKVGLHPGCHGQRGLHTSSMSELVDAPFSKPEKLLAMVNGLTLTKPKRPDECCGFGGTFCVTEEAVSVKMGKDRIKEHYDNKVEYITSGDSSCLMHLEGILKRRQSSIQVIHIAEILNAASYANN